LVTSIPPQKVKAVWKAVLQVFGAEPGHEFERLPGVYGVPRMIRSYSSMTDRFYAQVYERGLPSCKLICKHLRYLTVVRAWLQK
jgi:hypothetical protein